MKQLYAFHAVCNFFLKRKIILNAFAFTASLLFSISALSQCSNVTNGGQVGSDQSGCNGYDPTAFSNIAPPTGGSGALQIIWIYKSASTSWNFQTVPGANALSYDPGPIWETTIFRRCARRSGCSNYDGESNDVTVTITGLCGDPVEICNITGYDPAAERVFYIPNYGTDFRPVAGIGIHFARYANGEAHMYGQVERIGNTARKFDIDIWFYMRSNYTQWLAMGLAAHTPSLGDESTWVYYLFNPYKISTLTGQGLLAGTTLYVVDDSGSNFGLQLGEGANALNANVNGFSTWFDYTGTMTGDGDMNATYSCSDVCAGTCGTDTTPPTASNFTADVTIQCGTPLPVVTFNDNCSSVAVVSYEETIISSNACSNTLLREWVVSDACGNQATITQTVHETDTQPPVLSGIPADTTIQCDGSIAQPNVSATDNCDENVVITLHQVTGEGCPYSITNTWTATDACGNSTSATQVIMILDETVPVITGVPSDTSVSCDATINTPAVFATDNCDANVELNYSEITGSGCPYTITRTWTAEDDCGNLSTAIQVITISDNVAPIIYGVPSDLNLECGAAIPEVSVFAIDNCDEGAIVSLEAHTDDVECGENFVRTWTAVDACGNSSVETQTIFIRDTEAPQLNGVPANVTVECAGVPDVAEVSGFDVCDGTVMVELVETTSAGICPFIITRRWTASDACGNMASATQVITITDTMDPQVVSAPEMEISVECSADLVMIVPEFTDNCDDELSIQFFEGISNETPCGHDIERSWVATDNCGNNVVVTQIAHVVDTTAPVLVGIPEETSAECGSSPAEANVTAEDNCNTDVALEMSEEITAAMCGYTITRTWTATDNCGNSASGAQVIHIIDTTAPVLIGIPADVSVSCDELPAPPAVTALDNCDTATEVFFSEVNSGESCDFLLIRTWTATDACGNTVALSQTITVHDEEAPEVVFAPQDITYQCDEMILEVEPVFADNCDTDLIVIPETDTELAGCNYIIHKTWTALDNCGNSITVQHNITVVDTIAPVFQDGIEDVAVFCGEIPSIQEPAATDNCDFTVAIEFTDEITGECPFTITRTWVATDDCGNSTTMQQLINVTDNTPPQFAAIENIEVECGMVPDAENLLATDDCDAAPEVMLNEQTSAIDNCTTQIIRTWTATDNCGNTATAQQTVIITDTTPPVIIGAPSDVSISCGEAIPDVNAIAVDDCDGFPVVSLEAHTEVVDCLKYFTRTWTATDVCGNTSSVTQVITITDENAPVLLNAPADITIQCDDDVPTPSTDITAADDCDEADIAVSYIDEASTSACGGLIKRTYYAYDACGNYASHIQDITIVDETAPQLFNVPADVTIDCNDLLPSVSTEVTGTDNCDLEVLITTHDVYEGEECSYHIKRYYTATDDCGNQLSVPQIITVIDQTLPVFNATPSDIIVACDQVPDPMELSATDNCDPNVMVIFSETGGMDECPYIITRTWTATDNCGNSESIVQLLTVIDTIPPTFPELAPYTPVECDELADYMINAMDNCDDAPLVTVIQELQFSGECYGSVERTYQATDKCGNTSTITQLINVIDTTAPVLLNVPADIIASCDTDAPEVALVTASDNCSLRIPVVFSEYVTAEFCPYDLVRTWTATDHCGNTVSATQTIHFDFDETPVVFFRAFPNPIASGQLKIQFSVPKDQQARGAVCDLAGRCIMPLIQGEAMAGTLYQWFLDTETLGVGTYTVSMTVGDKVYNERIMVLSEQ